MLIIKQDNVLNDLKSYPDNHFHTILADPPYNLSTEWIIGQNGNPVVKNKPKDFMNKWEGLDENSLEELFKQFYRVGKYGSYLILFGLNRQLMPFNYYAMKAGYEICQSLYWFFISSFPKATDLSKQLDKRLGSEREVIGKSNRHGGGIVGNGTSYEINPEIPNITAPSSDLAKQFDGYKYGIAPFKEAVETIMVFRKSPKESILDDIINGEADCSPCCVDIDGGRVPYTPNNPPIPQLAQGKTDIKSDNSMHGRQSFNESKTKSEIGGDLSGRYPSTLLVDSGMAEILDEQSGIKTSAKSKVLHEEYTNNFKFGGGLSTPDNQYSDTGGASRILHKCDYDNEDYHLLNFSSKVQTKERNAGLERNNHPCLKPVSLIYRISQLFKLPIDNQKLYIPFAGTFSEVIGSFKAGFDDITVCEMNPDYIEIGKARFDHWKDKPITTDSKEVVKKDEPIALDDLF